MIILGIDPGLISTGWGIIEFDRGQLRHIANDTVKVPTNLPMHGRLACIFNGLTEVIKTYSPAEAALEETFVNMNPQSTLKLGAARGVAMLSSGVAGIPVAEYAPTLVKLAVTGKGRAAKEQVTMMVGILLGKPAVDSEHSADALAIAITHAHLRTQIHP